MLLQDLRGYRVKAGDVFEDDWGWKNRIDKIEDGICRISPVEGTSDGLHDRVSVDYVKQCILYDNDKRA